MGNRPNTTRTITDQVINRRHKDQLVDRTNRELDNYLDSIDSELKQPLRLKADVNGSYIVQVESIEIENPETSVKRVRRPIKKKIPSFTGGTISFPSTSGNPIVATPGQGEQLNVPNDQYAKILVQIDSDGSLFLRQGFPGATADDAELPKAKSGLHSIGYILIKMGAGGVLEHIDESNIYQFYGPDDTQDYVESLRLLEDRDNYKRVILSASDFEGSDGNIWSQTLEGRKLEFNGARINFETGAITTLGGSALGQNFTPTTIPDGFWIWYSVNLIPVSGDSLNRQTARVLVVPATAPGSTMNDAPRAPWAHQDKAIRIGQVAVQVINSSNIENIFDAQIIQKADFTSQGEGKRFGVEDVSSLKAIPLYDRHDRMLRLVDSDLQGRGVLYRWDEGDDSSPDTTGLTEIGEAPKVIEPDDGEGRWKTITAMDIGASVVRTDMIRNRNVTLAKLATGNAYHILSYNASGIPTNRHLVNLQSGSAAVPSFSFASDQDTGLYRAGDGSLAYSSNAETKWLHSFSSSEDNFTHQSSNKDVHVRVSSEDSYISKFSAYGTSQGTGMFYAGRSINDGGGFGFNGDNVPPVTFGRTNAVSFFRRNAGTDSEVFWYRRTNNNPHFNGGVALQDLGGTVINPEPNYLLLTNNNNSLQMVTSTGTTINVPNQQEADQRYLRRNATSVPTSNQAFNLGSSSARWNNIYAVTFQGNATSANYADVAERYESDEILEPGTVVKLGGPKEIQKTTRQNDTEVFGVISTDPALRMNEDAGDDDTHPFVALTGRVPCKVIGRIAKGQRLCTSDVAGVAKAYTGSSPFAVIGRALENKNTDSIGIIEVVVGKM